MSDTGPDNPSSSRPPPPPPPSSPPPSSPPPTSPSSFAGSEQAAAVDEQGRLSDDILCRQCGYNLRMQPLEGRCPECGAPVRLSASGFYLRFAEPNWVKRLARGALLIIIAMVGGFVGYIAVVGVAMTVAFAGVNSPGPPMPVVVMMVLQAVVGLGIAALVLAGVYQLTTPDPARSATPEGLSARRLARWCLWPLPLVFVGGFAASAINSTRLGFGPAGVLMAVIVGITAIASLVGGVVMPAALLRHFMNLMRRVPRPGLVTFAKIEFWGYIVCSVLGVASYVVLIFALIIPSAAAAAVAAPTTAPAGTPAGSQVVTLSGPGGATTTMPASAFAAAAPATGMLVASLVMGLAGCGGMIVSIAGLVLLIMVWLTLADAAREAALHAAAIDRATGGGAAPLPAG